ncbi:GIY-YIG nuclease family protein [Aspergillus undulatus]|uniref:GIY-YIG nuclease family protein n=1 Tax=Aspergillus undulatus TaxID=1810928 RepID=UPI003CCD690D
MTDMMSKSYNDKNDKPGHAYVLFDACDQTPFIKIGSSNNVRSRMGTHRRQCQLETWNLRQRPAKPISRPMRLERIVQAELRNLVCNPQCACGVKHTEYFWASKEAGVELLDFWAGWLQTHEPYDSQENLKDFWFDRLNHFKDNAQKYFRCGSEQCADQDEDAPACQACVRAGWKKWAEPEISDKIDYACRKATSYSVGRQILKGFSRFGFIDETNIIGLAQGLEQFLTMWQWLSDPIVFLCAIELRLLGFWVEPKVHLPDHASFWLQSLVNGTLLLVGVQTLFRIQEWKRELREAKESPRKSPGKSKKAKRPGLGGSIQHLSEEGEYIAASTSPLRANNSSGRQSSGRKRKSI